MNNELNYILNNKLNDKLNNILNYKNDKVNYVKLNIK